MTIQCYFVGGSPFAWRVMLALGHKGLKYDAKELHFSKGDTKTTEYLALNPRGKVPTLVDGDVTVYESLAILAYLEKAYPENPIFGDTPEDAARIWQRTLEFEQYFGAAVPGTLRPIFLNEVEGNEKSILENLEILKIELAKTAAWLDDADYMAGEQVSAVDMAVYPALALVERVLGNASVEGMDVTFLPFDQAYPKISAWMARMETLQGFDAAYPPHWRKAAA